LGIFRLGHAANASEELFLSPQQHGELISLLEGMRRKYPGRCSTLIAPGAEPEVGDDLQDIVLDGDGTVRPFESAPADIFGPFPLIAETRLEEAWDVLTLRGKGVNSAGVLEC
jgi:hypothetical protein